MYWWAFINYSFCNSGSKPLISVWYNMKECGQRNVEDRSLSISALPVIFLPACDTAMHGLHRGSGTVGNKKYCPWFWISLVVDTHSAWQLLVATVVSGVTVNSCLVVFEERGSIFLGEKMICFEAIDFFFSFSFFAQLPLNEFGVCLLW